MRTKMFAIAAAMALIAGGTALAFSLTGNKAQADTPAPAVVQADEAAGCCVTGDCCCPGQGACCDLAARAKATASVKKAAGCCATGNCCCPGQGSCCGDRTQVTTETKTCCAAKTESSGDRCEK